VDVEREEIATALTASALIALARIVLTNEDGYKNWIQSETTLHI
jgi:hypothetical protein